MNLPNDTTVLIIGLGYMAERYVRILGELGVPSVNIVGFDADEARRMKFREDFGGMETVESLVEGLDRQPDAAFILTNTPSHKDFLVAVLGAGVTRVFLEKPIVLDISELPALHQAVARCEITPVIEVGYLINFSHAVFELVAMMVGEDLMVIEGRGGWGKSRFGDHRPSAGDAEDELTHPFNVLLNLARMGRTRPDIIVHSAAFTHTPFVDWETQRVAAQRDPTFPTYPSATSQVCALVATAVPILVQSSFVSFETHRWIEVTLAQARELGRPTHTVRIEFDTEGEDLLRVRDLRENPRGEVSTEHFDAKAKLVDQTAAFLGHACRGTPDPRATSFTSACAMVELLGDAMKPGNLL